MNRNLIGQNNKALLEIGIFKMYAISKQLGLGGCISFEESFIPLPPSFKFLEEKKPKLSCKRSGLPASLYFRTRVCGLDLLKQFQGKHASEKCEEIRHSRLGQ